MKKFFTLLAGVALMATTANAADWYISGQFQGWSHCQADYQFKATSEAGVFECTFPTTKTMSGGFVIVQGTLNTPNWSNKIGTNGSTVQLDTPYNYRAGANDFTCAGSFDATGVTLNTNNQTITIHGQKAQNSFDTVYMVGQINSGSWNESITNFPLAKTAENTYEADYTLTAATNYIKFKAGNVIMGNGMEYGNDTFVTSGNTYDVVSYGQAYVLDAGEYHFKMVVDQDAENGQFTVTQIGEKTFPETLWMIGNVNAFVQDDWAANNGFFLSNQGEGVYTGEYIEIGDSRGSGFGYFSFSTGIGEDESDWDSLGVRYGASENDFEVVFDQEMTLGTNGQNAFKIASNALYNVTVNLDKMTVTVSKVVEVVPEYPEDVTAEQWAAAAIVPEGLTVEDFAIKGKSDAETVTITFAMPEGYNTVYVAYEDDAIDAESVSPEKWADATEIAFTGAVKGNSVEIPVDGKDHFVTVYFGMDELVNLDSKTYTVNIESTNTVGVEMVAAEANATYFNLQGARVANPVNGIFVKVVNGKAVKVVK